MRSPNNQDLIRSQSTIYPHVSVRTAAVLSTSVAIPEVLAKTYRHQRAPTSMMWRACIAHPPTRQAPPLISYGRWRTDRGQSVTALRDAHPQSEPMSAPTQPMTQTFARMPCTCHNVADHFGFICIVTLLLGAAAACKSPATIVCVCVSHPPVGTTPPHLTDITSHAVGHHTYHRFDKVSPRIMPAQCQARLLVKHAPPTGAAVELKPCSSIIGTRFQRLSRGVKQPASASERPSPMTRPCLLKAARVILAVCMCKCACMLTSFSVGCPRPHHACESGTVPTDSHQ